MKKRVWSLFDLAVVLLLVGGALAWVFIINRPPPPETSFPVGQARFLIEVQNVTMEQIEAVSPGDDLQDAVRHLPIGQVVSVTYDPHENRVHDHETETISWAVAPERYNLRIVVETEVTETEDAILAEGQVIILGGAPISFTGPGYAFTAGFVLGWERGGMES